METEPEVTADPSTWPAWLREARERAEKATAEVRRRRRKAETKRGRANAQGKRK